jgi:SAM-dependent methyltransferase
VDAWDRWLSVDRYTGLSAQEVQGGMQLIAGIRAQLLQQAGLRAGQSVLEIGCGPGEFLPTLLDVVGIAGGVAALDVSPQLCARASAVLAQHPLGHRGRVTQGDMRQLPHAGGSFDVVLCRAVLQYAGSDLPAVAAEIARVLRPGGRFVSFEVLSANERPMLPLPRTEGQRRARAAAVARWRRLPYRISRGALVAAFTPPAFSRTSVSASVVDWVQPFSRAQFANVLSQVPRPGCPTLEEVYTRDLDPELRAHWDDLLATATHAAQRGAWAYVSAVRDTAGGGPAGV